MKTILIRSRFTVFESLLFAAFTIILFVMVAVKFKAQGFCRTSIIFAIFWAGVLWLTYFVTHRNALRLDTVGISILSGSRIVLSVPWNEIDFVGFANFPSFSRGIYSGVKNFVGVRLMRTSKLCLEPKYISNLKYSGYDILITDCYALGLGEFVKILNERHAEFKNHGG